ncbi:hypothetical protein LTR37_008982 [Vermiconidia calcicola]|uniref:Uncharacterized protein n=1 Tax=Vermiconidia calcicola TaxID=1690605 RepID=A0ACC3N979_9PEZI|nr:hypothetical protein LTR37_008982 [Vermiconidia calcicola]
MATPTGGRNGRRSAKSEQPKERTHASDDEKEQPDQAESTDHEDFSRPPPMNNASAMQERSKIRDMIDRIDKPDEESKGKEMTIPGGRQGAAGLPPPPPQPDDTPARPQPQAPQPPVQQPPAPQPQAPHTVQQPPVQQPQAPQPPVQQPPVQQPPVQQPPVQQPPVQQPLVQQPPVPQPRRRWNTISLAGILLIAFILGVVPSLRTSWWNGLCEIYHASWPNSFSDEIADDTTTLATPADTLYPNLMQGAANFDLLNYKFAEMASSIDLTHVLGVVETQIDGVTTYVGTVYSRVCPLDAAARTNGRTWLDQGNCGLVAGVLNEMIDSTNLLRDFHLSVAVELGHDVRVMQELTPLAVGWDTASLNEAMRARDLAASATGNNSASALWAAVQDLVGTGSGSAKMKDLQGQLHRANSLAEQITILLHDRAPVWTTLGARADQSVQTIDLLLQKIRAATASAQLTRDEWDRECMGLWAQVFGCRLGEEPEREAAALVQVELQLRFLRDLYAQVRQIYRGLETELKTMAEIARVSGAENEEEDGPTRTFSQAEELRWVTTGKVNRNALVENWFNGRRKLEEGQQELLRIGAKQPLLGTPTLKEDE